jgi:hypothetical protein
MLLTRRRATCSVAASADSCYELDQLRRACRAYGQAPLGVRTIPIASIVGTIGRCCDFDRCFNAIRPHLRRAVTAVRRAFPDGAVPAIDVVKLGDEYFVSDGHKRIAAARAAGSDYVDADVTAVFARRRPPAATMA